MFDPCFLVVNALMKNNKICLTTKSYTYELNVTFYVPYGVRYRE